MRVEGEPAYILHRRAYRNTSLIVDAFTPKFGRVALVGRGARARGRSGNVALEPFVPLLIGWSGRGEMNTLTSAEASAGLTLLRGIELAAGLYLNELILRLLPVGVAHPGVFGAYVTAIVSVSSGDHSLEATLRRFEWALLDDIGLGLILDRDSEGQVLEARAHYAYEPASGPLRVPSGSAHDGPTFAGASLIAFRDGRLYDGAALRDCKRLTRRVLDYHLDGRPMRSRDFLRTMVNGGKQGARSLKGAGRRREGT